MISPKDKFIQASGGGTRPAIENDTFQFHMVDWDQRKVFLCFGVFAFKIDYEVEVEEEWLDTIYDTLRRCVDDLPPDVWALALDSQYELLSLSTTPHFGDERLAPFYPPLSKCPMLASAKTIRRSELVEQERLAILVDLCYYQTLTGRKQVIFKYDIIPEWVHRNYKEINIWHGLPPNPYIARFDRVVLDEVEDRVVGFTATYITGGTWDSNAPTLVNLQWFQQLMAAVDDLNLKYGIQHCDIHPRNVLIDRASDKIQLIDFDYALRLNSQPYKPTRDDGVGAIFTLYEIITRDYSYRADQWDYPDVKVVLEMEECPLHPDVRLDHDLAVFRNGLSSWLAERGRSSNTSVGTAEHQSNPWDPRLPGMSDGFQLWDHMEDLERTGDYYVKWQRPAQCKLVQGVEYLANGQVLEGGLPVIEQ